MKYILWDFNGTIIDDTQLCFDIEIKMLKDRNMYHDYDLKWYRDHFRFPVIDYYYDLGYTFEKEDFHDISIEFNDIYNKEFNTIPLMDGFIEKIEEAIAKGYRNIIISASMQDNLIRQCKALGIDKYFDELIGIDNLHAGSKIDRALEWMNKSKIDAKMCKYIGDTDHDREVAIALGIEDYILIACGHQSYEVLEKSTNKICHRLYEVEL